MKNQHIYPSAFRLLLVFVISIAFFSAQSYSQCVPAPPDMRHWWPGDGNADDIIGTNDGTMQNGATFVPGLIGQGFSFDGVNDHVSIPINLSGIPSLSFWMQTSTANQSIADGGPSYFTWRIEINAGGQIVYRHFRNGVMGYVVITGTSVVSDGQYHLITTTADAPNKTISLYVDGQLEASYTEPSSGFINWAGSAPGDVKFGKSDTRGLPGPRHFTGILDEVQHYSRALTAGEVLALYNAGSSGVCRPGQLVPTLSQWGMILLALSILSVGAIYLHRRKWSHSLPA